MTRTSNAKTRKRKQSVVFIQQKLVIEKRIKFRLPPSYVAPFGHRWHPSWPPGCSQLTRSSSADSDSLCVLCGTDDTPRWRKGPAGSKSLCNACGLHYQTMMRKERAIPPVTDLRSIPVESLLNEEEPPDKPPSG